MAGGDDAARASAAADALREGLCVDSDDDAVAAEPPARAPADAADAARGEGGGAPPSLAAQVEQLKEVIDGLKAALHAERTTVRDKDVQIHKLLAERDLVVGDHRRAAQKEIEALKEQLAKERETAREMETQLQDVLSLWENAASEARGDAAAEVAELRKQVEQLQEKLTSQDSAARASEATVRAEMEQIMRLWEEAQHNHAAEVEALQDRILELRSSERVRREQLNRMESRFEGGY